MSPNIHPFFYRMVSSHYNTCFCCELRELHPRHRVVEREPGRLHLDDVGDIDRTALEHHHYPGSDDDPGAEGVLGLVDLDMQLGLADVGIGLQRLTLFLEHDSPLSLVKKRERKLADMVFCLRSISHT